LFGTFDLRDICSFHFFWVDSNGLGMTTGL
jgi:hypothetical protein